MTVYLVYSVTIGDRYDFEDAADSTIFASRVDAEAHKEMLQAPDRWGYSGNEVMIVEKTIN